MSLNQRLNELATDAANLRAADLSSLARLRTDLDGLAESMADGERQVIAAACRQAADAAESILRHTATDADAAIAQIRATIEHVRQIARAITRPGGQSPGGSPPLLSDQIRDAVGGEFAHELRDHIAHARRALLGQDTQTPARERVETALRAFHTIKGAAAFLECQDIVALTHAAESLLDRARRQQPVLDAEHRDLLLRACDLLDRCTLNRDERGPRLKAACELLVRDLAAAGGPTQTPEPATHTDDSRSAAPPGAIPAVPGPTVRVSVAHLKRLQKLTVGLRSALAEQRTGEVSDATRPPEAHRSHERIAGLLQELEATERALRLVSLAPICRSLELLVEHLANQTGKRLSLHVEGDRTEVSRWLAEQIADALIQLVRNACDHGIEPPAARVAAGKQAEGSLRLRVSRADSTLVIEFCDDGRGLSRQRITDSARQAGALPAHREAAAMTDDEVWALIFTPGLSTASELSAISGRGVGMDVVRQSIAALGGTIEVRSRPGAGTTFILRIPRS